MKEKIKEVQDERLSVCKDCPSNSSQGEIKGLSYCKECLCNLNAKTACLNCECPLSKWASVVSLEERVEIEQRIKEDEGHEEE